MVDSDAELQIRRLIQRDLQRSTQKYHHFSPRWSLMVAHLAMFMRVVLRKQRTHT